MKFLKAFRKPRRLAEPGRVAIVGNSHIAGLKAGLNDLADNADYEFVFWGETGKSFDNIYLEDGVLKGARPRLCERVNGGRYLDLPLSDFTAIVLHAVADRPHWKLRDMKVESHDLTRLSSAMLKAMVEKQMNRVPGLQLAKEILKHTKMPVIISPQPVPTAGSNFFGDAPPRAEELDIWYRLRADLLSDLGFVYVTQSKDSFEATGYTAEQFTTGSVRLWGDGTRAHDADDFVHMNGRYGALVLRDIVARLGAPAEIR
ncbi:hypothetical protein [Halovulum sp. GXIMD14793]